jgi:ATP-dependent protease ClpP protease subunit
MKQLAVAALLSSMVWPCFAARIEVNQATIAIDGDIEFGDFEVFQSKTRFLSQATVILKSNGGKIVPAIKIGEVIRQKAFATYVEDYCASACTLIWLAGSQRYMAATAQIGFHAAYNNDTGQEAGMANAIVGAYLTKIGLPYEAVIYATVAKPDDMRWLTVADAKRVGISVTVVNPEPVAAQSPKPANTQPSLKEQALTFVRYYFANWNTNSYPQVFDDLYWDSADYFGQITSKKDILADKLRVIETWPVRNYKLRSAEATCSLTECSVSGIVDWVASNQNKRSTGSADFQFVLRPWPLGGAGTDDKLRISGEYGKVLSSSMSDKCEGLKILWLCAQ